MYAFVRLTGDKGRAFEDYARNMEKPAGDLIAGLIEAWIDDINLKIPPAPEPPQGLDRFTAAFIKMRDTKSALKKAFEAEAAEIDKQMEKVGSHLLSKLNAEGVDSMKTASATFYKEKVMKPSCGDWDAFYGWIKENDAFEFLERRVTKTAVQGYMEEHGVLPPGVNTLDVFEIRVRRGKDS